MYYSILLTRTISISKQFIRLFTLNGQLYLFDQDILSLFSMKFNYKWAIEEGILYSTEKIENMQYLILIIFPQ
jgi:hypothetical protein